MRQFAAEESVMRAFLNTGWIDAYRYLHPATDELKHDHSFRRRNRQVVRLSRFDHVLMSGLRPTEALYDLGTLEANLSDHAALIIDFAGPESGYTDGARRGAMQ